MIRRFNYLSILSRIIFFASFVASHVAYASAPDWARFATVAGLDIHRSMGRQELQNQLDLRKSEFVSVLELDSRLSEYIPSAQEFNLEVEFLDQVADMAHDSGMRAVVYYPALEVLTPDGKAGLRSMFKDHPNWVQRGIGGKPNVFYDSAEVWVPDGAESAWMSPNGPYRQFFLNRVKQLAGTSLDGIWLDVPLYLDTGSEWSGVSDAAVTDFQQWAADNELGDVSAPLEQNWDNKNFRLWLRWRHENLATFLHDIRAAAHSINPDFLVVVENYPMDYIDATLSGLDALYSNALYGAQNNFIHVWEVDSVSNTKAMQWAQPEDFRSKIAMYKWGVAASEGQPSWAFSYGAEPLDAGLAMAATLATGNVPFEAKTPSMISSVDSDFRKKWYGFAQKHATALFGEPRQARVGIWYSSPSRDYIDSPRGGYGMYFSTVPGIEDPDWWANHPDDSPLVNPHLGSYRALADALSRSHIPYSIVADPSPTTKKLLDGLDVLLLPNVEAISVPAINSILEFVHNGGTAIIVGRMLGAMDESGDPREHNPVLKKLDKEYSENRTNRINTEQAWKHGRGIVFHKPGWTAEALIGLSNNEENEADVIRSLRKLVRIHSEDDFFVNGSDNIHVEIAKQRVDRHHLFLLNYSGLQQPLQQKAANVEIQYRIPEGLVLKRAELNQPGHAESLVLYDYELEISHKTRPTAGVSALHSFSTDIDQFAILTMEFGQKENTSQAIEPLEFQSFDRAEAVDQALQFILNNMRDLQLEEPNRHGVFTNLIKDQSSEIFAVGHHVALEQMGVMLRTAACLRDETLFADTSQYISELMLAPDYKVLNWAIDHNSQAPLLFNSVDEDGNVDWFNANAPLDDLRAVRGLLEGYDAFSDHDYLTLAKQILRGLLATSVGVEATQISQYAEGLIGYAFDWQGTGPNEHQPEALHSTKGSLYLEPIPVDYQDLATLALAARHDPRWLPVLRSSTQMSLDAEIEQSPGLFFNGYQRDGLWTGDFENRDSNQGKHLKVIQVLWTAIHLAELSIAETPLEPGLVLAAGSAAKRSLQFFRNFYQREQRVPEYLTFDGQDVTACDRDRTVSDCLLSDTENLRNGEARIYALLARLALILRANEYADQIIAEKILSDRISDPEHPQFGMIGPSSAATGDAEIFNIVEPLLTLCMAETSVGNNVTARADEGNSVDSASGRPATEHSNKSPWQMLIDRLGNHMPVSSAN